MTAPTNGTQIASPATAPGRRRRWRVVFVVTAALVGACTAYPYRYPFLVAFGPSAWVESPRTTPDPDGGDSGSVPAGALGLRLPAALRPLDAVRRDTVGVRVYVFRFSTPVWYDLGGHTHSDVRATVEVAGGPRPTPVRPSAVETGEAEDVAWAALPPPTWAPVAPAYVRPEGTVRVFSDSLRTVGWFSPAVYVPRRHYVLIRPGGRVRVNITVRRPLPLTDGAMVRALRRAAASLRVVAALDSALSVPTATRGAPHARH